MKAKFAILILAVSALFVSACEKHSWSNTKKLFQEHEQAAKPGHDEAKAPEAPSVAK